MASVSLQRRHTLIQAPSSYTRDVSMLPQHEMAYLKEHCPGHSVTAEGGMVCVVIPALQLGSGFNHAEADLLLRLAPGYPDVPPDMWWFSPSVARLDGRTIPATEVMETHMGRSWQRWSRHLDPTHWKSGIDSLESYLSLVRKELYAAKN
jgi:hypothetical protein